MTNLTISIVTKGRIKEFRNCIKRLVRLKDINQVHISVGDNSNIAVYLIKWLILWYYGKSLDYSIFHTKEFVECRNLAIHRCFTPYFTLLDDDDFYTDDAIEVMLQFIKNYPLIDMFSYTVLKESLYDNTQSTEIRFYSVRDKVASLNRFDNYESDRYDKVYLWNCGHVIRTSILKNIKFGWGPLGCDDIIPITQAYINSDRVFRILYPIYLYPQQTTVCSKKTVAQCTELELHIIESYARLLSLYHDYADYRKSLIRKSIANSIRQLEHIDQYTPVALIKLYNMI